jgi:hypothetical protein
MKIRRASMVCLVWMCGACVAESDDSGGSSEGGSESSGSAPTEGAADGCTNTVVLGRYPDDTCTPGTEMGTVTLDLAVSCGVWSRDSPMGTKDDSFTRYQCYEDRLCFTVHPGSASCEVGGEDADIELMAGVCQPDKNVVPGITPHTKILSGLAGCPAAPEGFACPNSAVGEATPGVVACSG